MRMHANSLRISPSARLIPYYETIYRNLKKGISTGRIAWLNSHYMFIKTAAGDLEIDVGHETKETHQCQLSSIS